LVDRAFSELLPAQLRGRNCSTGLFHDAIDGIQRLRKTPFKHPITKSRYIKERA